MRIARADGGVVHPVLVVPESAPFSPKAAREHLGRVVAAVGVDGLPTTIVNQSVLHGALRAGAAEEATLVLVSEPPERDSSRHETPGADTSAGAHTHAPPVAIVHGSADRLGIVRTLLGGGGEGEGEGNGDGDSSSTVTAEMARRVAGRPADRLDGNDPDWLASLAPGDVTFVSTRLGEALAEFGSAGRGMVVATLSGHDDGSDGG